MSASPLGFADWFAPHSVPEFRRGALGRRPLLLPPRTDLAERVLANLEIDSLQKVLALRGARVYAWFQKLDGHHAAAAIPATSGERFYEAGTTLYVRHIESFETAEREVANELGIPRVAVESAIFCNRPEAVTRPHFDRADLIIIQLRGRKNWRVAPNTFAPEPLFRWATLDRVSPDIRLYADDVPPTEIPSNASTHVLEPGAIFHLPRGYWHETSSDRDSMSLHIQISSPTRLDVMLNTLKNELARDQWWREPAYDFSAGDPNAFEDAETARTSLSKAALRLDPRDTVRAPSESSPVSNSTRFVRAGQSAFAIDALNAGRETARVTLISYEFRETTITHVDMGLPFVAACRWINALTTGTPFDVSELLRSVPGLELKKAKSLLALLERTHLVRRHD